MMARPLHGKKGAHVNPRSLKYHKEHDWARVEGDLAVFGLTAYAQESLGDIVFIELPEVGTEVSANTTYAEVESVKAVSDVYAPLSGTVVEINEEVVDAPEMINESPYEEGWLVKIKLADASEADDLLSAEEYEEMLSEQEE
jgi:glycine cleavage system H protein